MGAKMLQHRRRHDLHEALAEAVTWRGDEEGRHEIVLRTAQLAAERRKKRRGRHEENVVGVRKTLPTSAFRDSRKGLGKQMLGAYLYHRTILLSTVVPPQTRPIE